MLCMAMVSSGDEVISTWCWQTIWFTAWCHLQWLLARMGGSEWRPLVKVGSMKYHLEIFLVVCCWPTNHSSYWLVPGCEWYAHLMFASGMGWLWSGSLVGHGQRRLENHVLRKWPNDISMTKNKGNHGVSWEIIWEEPKARNEKMGIWDHITSPTCNLWTLCQSSFFCEAYQGFDYRLAMAIPDMFIKYLGVIAMV